MSGYYTDSRGGVHMEGFEDADVRFRCRCIGGNFFDFSQGSLEDKMAEGCWLVCNALIGLQSSVSLDQPQKNEDFRFTDHAAFEIGRRRLDIEILRRILSHPGQVLEVRPGRHVYQSIVSLGKPPQAYLIRVFVDTDREPYEVVTAYKTSKISKYWRADNESNI